jgi:hypothetical protein
VYNLLVTGDPDAWRGRQAGMDWSRFCEYTPEPLKARFKQSDSSVLTELTRIPTLFAYESSVDLPAKVGWIANLRKDSSGGLRFDYSFAPGGFTVPPEAFNELAWELDVGGWEMNRTHWAIKDVDLAEALAGGGYPPVLPPRVVPDRAGPSYGQPLSVLPKVFAIPRVSQDPRLVALMMPFDPAFDEVSGAVRRACERAGLSCERVDDVWDESTIIQEIFNLVYRSSVVIVDLSGRNSNVMYEAGIAHTMGRDVVPISQSGEIPFDLAHHRALNYTQDATGLEKMTEKLERRLRRLTGGTA